MPVIRKLSLKEHQGISLLKQASIPVAPFGVSRNADGLYEEAKKIGEFIYLKMNVVIFIIFDERGTKNCSVIWLISYFVRRS